MERKEGKRLMQPEELIEHIATMSDEEYSKIDMNTLIWIMTCHQLKEEGRLNEFDGEGFFDEYIRGS
jgi:hypothetical protein